MDTIFVKSVKENGPAQQAGLCTGRKHTHTHIQETYERHAIDTQQNLGPHTCLNIYLVFSVQLPKFKSDITSPSIITEC